MSVIQTIIDANKAGQQAGIFAVCSAQPLVLQAALLQAKANGTPLLIEATANQVNQFGGYTGMKPQNFIDFVTQMAVELGLEPSQLLFGGDHLGPVVWCQQAAEEAMQLAEDLIAEYVKAGFTKIHLDTSMACGGDVLPLADELIAARAARLCAVAEAHRAPEQALCYVIGTEVPAPGGVSEMEAELAVTPVSAIEHTLNCHRAAFAEAGLGEEVWQKVIAVVVQPGVEFDNSQVHLFEPEATHAQSEFIRGYPRLVFEAHSTDYQLSMGYQALVQQHFAILKVGPQLTFALREALFALSHIENVLCQPEQCSDLRQSCFELMRDNPKYWQGFYADSEALKWQLGFSFSDRVRYYWPSLQSKVEQLLSNLAQSIPLPLISQYLPNQYTAVLAGELKPTARELVLHKITEVLADYANACQLPVMQSPLKG
ncbi:class II D-tagatose-bisphosphate aldolase, non-catalytic subunit [Shewanella mangrovisoli]|uniref:class II D-tagatose-bisphosphate aldolase, non-catalytic subunit n=1 Tax=Shewanella mangrovisoli TaxID=2864211 RepID=UPI001C65C688|nr:class II D-tagatose-bisphosphate aldolase, non-catalytic subunit [Shewanella mangrovisoli]QYK07859.1 class II D-tagatose-bisphosphate aldolase, non-catalytic subunit [Shewanella mangrovisoli]